jgi:excinuclease ABC subunit C
MTEHIKSILKALPVKAGVYQFQDDAGEIIYVGKAKNLKNRVSSYFLKQQFDQVKTKRLVEKIADIKYTVVESESDALLLENTLIKSLKPRYNILLKDDKSYASIVIKKEPFPRVFSTRQILTDGSKYFGPYTNGKALYTLLDVIKDVVPMRTCSLDLKQENITAGKFKVCLEYHLGNCLGPCEGKQNESDYLKGIEYVKRVIKGEITEVIKSLRNEMTVRAENLEFERAQRLKERITSLEQFKVKSTIVSSDIDQVGVLTLAMDGLTCFANWMVVNRGSIVQVYTAEVLRNVEQSEAETLFEVALNCIERSSHTVRQVLTECAIPYSVDGVSWLIPQRGDKRKLLDLSKKNAQFFLGESKKREAFLDPEKNTNRILETLKLDLRMSVLPTHIECFDNSNIQGTNPVSACVVFKNAKPSKKDYRIFNIETVQGPDDFASMTEAITRRYSRLIREKENLPQLLIIDGGKGQLSAALKALEALELSGKITTVGIAKRLEEIYFPGDDIPLYLDKRSESLKLIQHLRNEAHRFGLSKHRNRRSKQAIGSELDLIQGVGKQSKEKLLKSFGSVARIKQQTLENLQSAVGISIAKKVYDYFHFND